MAFNRTWIYSPTYRITKYCFPPSYDRAVWLQVDQVFLVPLGPENQTHSPSKHLPLPKVYKSISQEISGQHHLFHQTYLPFILGEEGLSFSHCTPGAWGLLSQPATCCWLPGASTIYPQVSTDWCHHLPSVPPFLASCPVYGSKNLAVAEAAILSAWAKFLPLPLLVFDLLVSLCYWLLMKQKLTCPTQAWPSLLKS